MLACIWVRSAGGQGSELWMDTQKPIQRWCPIKEGMPGEVTDVFDVIDYDFDYDSESE